MTVGLRPDARTRTLALWLAPALLALVACSGTSSSSPSRTAAAGASSRSASAGVTYADAQVAKYRELRTTFPEPGPALQGIAQRLSGKTVWYIPVFFQAATFQAEATSLTAALKTVGASVHVCDAQLNPSAADTCIRQAISSGAEGIVTSSIDNAFAEQAFQAAAAAKLPVILADDDETGANAVPASSFVRELSDAAPIWTALGADWVIADSGGHANVLYAADDASQGAVATKSVTNEFAAHCPECKVTIVHFSDAALPKLATAVSAAMVAHPAIDYIYGGYDVPAGIYALQGAKQITGRKLKFLTVSGAPAGLQRIANAEQAADAGVDTTALAWDMADALFRIISGVTQGNYEPGVRLFTSDNLPANTKDTDAYYSGEWYSNGGLQQMYTKLWGAS